MKRSTLCEILAWLLAWGGALALGFVYYPFLNPIQFKLSPGPVIEPAIRYFLGTPLALVILLMAWYFNNKSTALKRDLLKNSHVSPLLISWVSGLLLLAGFFFLVVAWVKWVHETPARWSTLALGVAPYVCFGFGTWLYRFDDRASLAMLLAIALAVALGVWAWWPLSPPNEADATIDRLFAIMASVVQLILSTLAWGFAALCSYSGK